MKKLFCFHKYSFVMSGSRHSVWSCSKCGKQKRKNKSYKSKKQIRNIDTGTHPNKEISLVHNVETEKKAIKKRTDKDAERESLVEKLREITEKNKADYDLAVKFGEAGLSPDLYNRYSETVKKIEKQTKDW